jgi:nitrogen fixation NifU-like protein
MPLSREEALEILMDHYEHPSHRGTVADASFTKSGGNPGCSDIVEMSARIGPDGTLEAVAFEGQGCTISMAAADFVAELVEGKTTEEVDAITADELMDALGRELVMTRPTCATIALTVLKQALHEHVMQQRIQGAP